MDRDTEQKAGKAMALGMGVFMLVFSLIWCAVVYAMGVWFMLIPGLLFVGLSGYRLGILWKLSREEPKKPPQDHPEPWDRPDTTSSRQPAGKGSRFCPYCGESLEPRFAFCPKCGRRL